VGQGFLHAICAEPWDDVQRLIMADWLDENGQGVRAVYIRRAVAYRLGHQDREDKALASLEKQHGREWAWPLGPLCEGVPWGCLFSRGFVYHVRTTPGAFVKNAACLFGLLPITSVSLKAGIRRNVGYCASRLFDAGMTRRGQPQDRLPGEIFPFLREVGMPCEVRGAVATGPPEAYLLSSRWGVRLVSRAAVAFGRHQAGLPPLAAEQYDTLDPAH
jgi:uncharacterized protein (TIGR02996 family)